VICPGLRPDAPTSRRTTTASASYLDNWLRTRQAIADLINSFSGLKTDINQRQQHCGLAHMSERAEAAAHAYHVVPC
jgi:hypothetical protein